MHDFFTHLIIAIIPLVFAITLHEAAHGWVALQCGDSTARMLGRVTLNPIKHIDPIGTIAMPLLMLAVSNFIFGYAKPVPVNWNQLRRPRRDMALVALAGPMTNLLMALGWAAIAKLSLQFATTYPSYLYLMALFGIQINIVLMVLNLLPIPPLDGSRVVSSLLSPRLALYYNSIEPYGIWILLILLIAGILAMIILPPTTAILQSIVTWFALPVR